MFVTEYTKGKFFHDRVYQNSNHLELEYLFVKLVGRVHIGLICIHSCQSMLWTSR